jgi:hypothetical protein
MGIGYEQSEKKTIKDLKDGYYWLQRKDNGEKFIISVAGGMIHFHNHMGLGYSEMKHYHNFSVGYIVLGKIKDFHVSNIEMEETYI